MQVWIQIFKSEVDGDLAYVFISSAWRLVFIVWGTLYSSSLPVEPLFCRIHTQWFGSELLLFKGVSFPYVHRIFWYSEKSCWQTNLDWFGFGCFFFLPTNESPEGCHTLVIGQCSFDGLCVSFQWSLCFLSISTKTLAYSWIYCTSSQYRLLGGGGLSSIKLVHMSPMFIWQGANLLCQKM